MKVDSLIECIENMCSELLTRNYRIISLPKICNNKLTETWHIDSWQREKCMVQDQQPYR